MERRDIPQLLPHTALSPFCFINDHDVSILLVLWEGPMFPDVLDQEVQATREDVSSVFENLCRDSIGSSAFIVLQPCNGSLDF